MTKLFQNRRMPFYQFGQMMYLDKISTADWVPFICSRFESQVAATANYAQTMMYWHIGERINREVLGNQRAEYRKNCRDSVTTIARRV